MDKFKEAAKLFRQLADLFDGLEGTAAPPSQAEADPAPAMAPTKWLQFRLQLEAPIGRPKAQRIIDRLAPTDQGRKQFAVQMGPGSNGTKTYVVAFIVKVTDRDGDAQEMASMVAAKMDERGSDKRARTKVASVQAVD